MNEPIFSKELLEACRKGLGLPPHNGPGNYLIGDGYYWQSVRTRYGEHEVQAAVKYLKENP